MRLKLSLGLSIALVGLVAGCGGRVAAQNTREGTGGGGAGGACSSCTGGAGGTGGGTQGPCDLSLVASGALPRRGQRDTESVAVAASSKNFAVAYIEQDPADAGGRNTALVNLSDSGQLGNVVRDDLPGCAGPPVSRGAAVTFDTSGSAGLAAFALSDCGGSGAGAMFYSLKAGAGPASPKIAANPGFKLLSLGPHALAPLAANRFTFVYAPFLTGASSVGGAQLATLTGDAFDTSVVELFGAQPADTAAVSSMGNVQAILGHLISGMEVLQIGAPDADAGTANEHQLGIEPWGAVTTIGGRVAVLLPTSTGLEYRLFESNQQVQKHFLSNTLTPQGDITALGDRLIAVGAGAGAISLYRIDHATTGTPSPGLTVPTNLQASSISQVAIAAARSTVAVVTAGNGTRGHWALFSCKN